MTKDRRGSEKPEVKDWTAGGQAICAQSCVACGKVWTFRREFCPGCGAREPQTLVSVGRGRVHAVTRVERAPSDEFRALAPYAIVLVDLDEGFRLMAHGELGLVIGEVVQGEVRSIAGRALPFFQRLPGGR